MPRTGVSIWDAHEAQQTQSNAGQSRVTSSLVKLKTAQNLRNYVISNLRN